MNYLAHLFLAPEDEDWQLGGILGDFVKGPIDERIIATYRPNVVNGIKLHRKIDLFSDQSTIFKRSATRINIKQKRFARVLIDMYFDHILAKHWSQLHPTSLTDFSRYIYEIVLKDRPENPEKFRLVSQLIVSEDWFRLYTSLEGIALQIERMGTRLKRGNALLGGARDLISHLGKFEADFFEFIYEAKIFSKKYVESLKPLAPSA